jgi:chromosome segregation protein
MYLSKLEVSGFKSFYNKISLKFNPGITGIVGPNGCGKSNVVDSIRWVLGEQRASALRSDKMENVIFAGTKKLKALGLAEVSLTIQNNKGILPTEYTEVTVTRRLYRSGESEYLLNKTVCRLRDINDLFMDTGIGFNAYSVIELKMIELILNDKTNERRRLLEEAAGVTKYKHRRQASLRKLEAVQQDLTRVQDIISEVEKVVRSLERQAKKAEQYNKLQEQLKGLEVEMIEREYSEIKNSIGPIKSRIEELKFTKTNIDSKLSSDEVDLEKVKKELIDIEQKVAIASKNLSNNSIEINRLEHEIQLQNERLKSLGESIIRYENENKNLSIEIDVHEDVRKRDLSIIEESQGILEEIEYRFEDKNEELKQINAVLAEKNTGIKELSDKKISIINEIASYRNKHSNIQYRVDSISQRDEDIEQEIEFDMDEMGKCDEQITILEKELDILKEAIKAAEKEFQEKEAEKETVKNEIESLQNKSFDIQSKIGKNISKVDLLRSLIEKNTGISESVQFLTRKSEWLDKPVQTVAEVINADAKYRVAIEAALGEIAGYIIVNSYHEANAGIEILKKTSHGKATFICLDKINSLKISEDSGSDSTVLKAMNVIRCDDQYKNLFKFLLKNVFVFEKVDDAIKFVDSHQNSCAITLEGEIFGGNGIVKGGSKRTDEGLLIGKKEQLKELVSEVESLKTELEENQKFLKERNIYFNSINLKDYADKIVKAGNNNSDMEKKISEFYVRKNNLRGSIDKITVEKNKLENDRIAFNKELSDAFPIIQNLENDLNLLEDDIEKAGKELSEIEYNRNRKNEEVNEIRIQLVSKSSEIQNYKNEMERSSNQVETIKKTIERHNNEIIEFRTEIGNLTESNLTYEKTLTELLENNVVFQEERDQVLNVYSTKKEEVTVVEKIIREGRRSHDEFLNELSDLEIRYNELKMRLENLRVRAKDDYQLDVQTRLFEDAGMFNFNEAKEQVRQIKEKIHSLGPVNSLAFEEYKTEKERLDFLLSQRSDLNESEKTLMETIEEINDTATTKFTETFDLIRTNFINVFKTLFDEGDEADLRFKDNIDPLEGEIEIVAKPKGKKPQSIEQLSGGEKTLTAISLLFAIYLVKPSPFCILDEVDAPLDDGNIDRFIKILRKFSDNTQFIVVTHNKKTMEASDTMYGVTMEEMGVSKIVSVQFNDDINLN